MTFFNPDEGATGPLHLGTGDDGDTESSAFCGSLLKHRLLVSNPFLRLETDRRPSAQLAHRSVPHPFAVFLANGWDSNKLILVPFHPLSAVRSHASGLAAPRNDKNAPDFHLAELKELSRNFRCR